MNGPHDSRDHRFDQGYDEGFGSETSEGLLLPPWERRERFGLLNGLYLTIKDVLLAPGQFFYRMPSRVGLAQPLLFAVVVGVTAAFFVWMWSLAGSPAHLLFSGDLGEALRRPWLYFLFFIFSPVIFSVAVVVKAAMIQLVLKLLGGNKLGFEATFRVAAYSEATGILVLIPFCGAPIGSIWGLVVLIIGLYSIHEIEPWKAVVAVLVPMILCLSVTSARVVTLMAGVIG